MKNGRQREGRKRESKLLGVLHPVNHYGNIREKKEKRRRDGGPEERKMKKKMKKNYREKS